MRVYNSIVNKRFTPQTHTETEREEKTMKNYKCYLSGVKMPETEMLTISVNNRGAAAGVAHVDKVFGKPDNGKPHAIPKTGYTVSFRFTVNDSVPETIAKLRVVFRDCYVVAEKAGTYRLTTAQFSKANGLADRLGESLKDIEISAFAVKSYGLDVNLVKRLVRDSACGIPYSVKGDVISLEDAFENVRDVLEAFDAIKVLSDTTRTVEDGGATVPKAVQKMRRYGENTAQGARSVDYRAYLDNDRTRNAKLVKGL